MKYTFKHPNPTMTIVVHESELVFSPVQMRYVTRNKTTRKRVRVKDTEQTDKPTEHGTQGRGGIVFTEKTSAYGVTEFFLRFDQFSFVC